MRNKGVQIALNKFPGISQLLGDSDFFVTMNFSDTPLCLTT